MEETVTAVVGHQVQALDAEAEAPPELGEHRDITRGPVAEGEVPPDDDLGGVQPVHEHLVGERGGLHALQLGGEREHAERVDPELGDQVGAAAQAGQPGRVAARADDLGRVRVERDQHRRQAAGAPALDRPIDQLLVSAVHAVEHADRHDAAAPTRRYGLQPPPALHRRSLRKELL